MSLLEDIFLQDEANEAQELERIIEGDEYDERVHLRSDSDNNSERENEAEEDKKRVDPTSAKTRRVIKNPRFILNPARLTGPRGIQVIPEHFKDFKFKGKGHEKEDLDLVLKKLEHWAYRLYPKFQFEDCLKKIETLGKKRPVMVHLQKIRTDQYLSEEVVVQKDSSDDDLPTEDAPPEDEFDKLLQQQIELVRSTPTPSSVKKGMDSARKENLTLLPKATSSPSISEEQRERILKSRKLAEERRIARLKNSKFNIPTLQNNSDNITNDNSLSKKPDEETPSSKEKDIVLKRVNRTNVIESSDEEEIVSMNESITVDVHKNLINANDHMNFTRKDRINDKNINNLVNNVSDLEEIKDSEDIEHISIGNNANENDNLENVSEENDNIQMNAKKPDEETPSSKEKDIVLKRVNKTNVIESSDEEEIVSMNESITVDVHKNLINANDQVNFTRKDRINDKNINSVENVSDLEEIKDSEDIEHISIGNNANENDNLENVSEENDIQMNVTEKEKSNYQAISQEITNEDCLKSGAEESEEQNNLDVEDLQKADDVVHIIEKEGDKDIEDLMDVDFDDDFRFNKKQY